MSVKGLTIPELNSITGGQITFNDVIPIVDIDTNQTLKINVKQLGSFIVSNVSPTANSNLGPIANITILGGNLGQVLSTYGNGSLYWGNNDNSGPGGPNTAVQYNIGNTLAGSSNFTFDPTTNTLSTINLVISDLYSNTANYNGNVAIENLTVNVALSGNTANFSGAVSIDGSNNTLSFAGDNGNTVSFAATNAASNLTFIVPNTSATSEQVLGVVDQANQVLGWKTLPTNYVEVELRNGNTYISSITPVLRVLPIKVRAGGFLSIPTV